MKYFAESLSVTSVHGSGSPVEIMIGQASEAAGVRAASERRLMLDIFTKSRRNVLRSCVKS